MAFNVNSPRVGWVILVFATLLTYSSPIAAQEDLLGDKPSASGDLADDILGDLGSSWWNEDWAIRRQVELEGPGLASSDEKIVYFEEPDPLLMYNTGRCQKEFADLRVLSAEGNPLPAGILNFGTDDGSCRIWVRLPAADRPRRGATSIYLYYGNPAAKAEKHVLPEKYRIPPPKPDVTAQAYEEEIREGAKLKLAAAGSFFADNIAIEAEDLELAVPQKKSATERIWTVRAEPTASGTELLEPQTAELAKPLVLTQTAKLPAAGKWKIHVRQRVLEPANTAAPFEISIGGQVLKFSATQQTSKVSTNTYRWSTLEVTLLEGNAELLVTLIKPCSLDSIILSRDPNYLPDARDINGPVWLRLKSPDAQTPYSIDYYSTHTTYSADGEQGNHTAFMLGDVAVIPKVLKQAAGRPALVTELAADKKHLIGTNQWSSWGCAAPRGSYTWYSRATLIAPPDVRPLKNVNVEFDFATRPDVSRVFRSGKEQLGPTSVLYIHMPSDTRLSQVRSMTKGFGEWSRERFELASALGFKENEGPKRLHTSTMARAHSPEDAKQILKTFSAIGLNSINIGYYGGSRPEDSLYDELGIRGWQDHAWSAFGVDETTFKRAEGQTWLAAYEAAVDSAADKFYGDMAESRKKISNWEWEKTIYNVFGDEIGPIVGAKYINSNPLIRSLFIEYLQEQGLKPEFFGVAKWDDLRAIDFAPPVETELERGERVNEVVDAAINIDGTTREKNVNDLLESPDGPAKSEVVISTKTRTVVDTKAIEEGRQGQELIDGSPDATKATLEQKRTYYYTQKFRSFITALFYRHASAGMRKHFPNLEMSSVNLQSMPVMIGRMWDGGLNIFDLGRMQAFDTIQIEDWWSSHTNVQFGMALLRAAGRKHGLNQAALLVDGRPGTRIMADLMQGSRALHFYLYGPIYNIGPVWAEDQETLKQIGTTLRQVARCEDDLLAAINRPCEAAVLVANSSESNSPFYTYPFDKERLHAFVALADTQIPVEVVGEEEILEDGALARYKVLYVGDPHVNVVVQQKIKAWVAAGGTLWSSYAGLARTEFDEPSHLFDEVFGLESRGELKPFSYAGYGATPFGPGPGVMIPQGDLLAADQIESVYQGANTKEAAGFHVYGDYKVAQGKVVATFDNGKPAIVLNKFGKGEAMLCGFAAGPSFGAYVPGQFAHSPYSPNSTALRAQLWTALARRAGVQPHATLAHPRFMVQTAVHDGPEQTILFVLNCSPDALAKEIVTVASERPIESAYSSTGEEVSFTADKGQVQTTIDLPANEGKIIVFRHPRIASPSSR
jgi:hypothetical protein